MFKQITALSLLLAFVAQTFSGSFVMLNYYTNTAAFAKDCVNKARPKMHCNGKCQMVKKLQEEEKRDQQLPERKFEKKIEMFSSKSFFCHIELITVTAAKAVAFEKKYPLTDIVLAFFHPPQV